MPVVSDNAAHINSAVEAFVGPLKQLGCQAHLLSHLVPDVMKYEKGREPQIEAIDKIILKIRAIVTQVKKSTVCADELKKLQIVLDGKEKGDFKIYRRYRNQVELQLLYDRKIS